MTAQPAILTEDASIYLGDCLDVLAEMSDNSIDAIVTDPPYGLGFMGKAWDDLPPGLPWAEECLRVLKPGGHLLAFGGTRTWHRLAVAVEDAGFEVRDSIAWLYGSGFPKSLDVSKAIDKAAGATREVVGHADRKASLGSTGVLGASNFGEVPVITAPATPAAQQWQGWGTALKPAFEPIVVARKPLIAPGINVLDAVESSLRDQGVTGEIKWTNGPASGAARPDQSTSSSATPQRPAAGTSASHADGSETPSAELPTGNSSATTTPHGGTPTESTSATTPDARPQSCETKSSPLTATPAPAAESAPASSSPSITSTEAAPPTARRRGARSTPRSGEKASLPVTESFAGTATGLTGSRGTVRIDRLADGTFVWPDGLPRSIPGGPITVAANVLAHGTGALNIDATRVGTDGGTRLAEVTSKGEGIYEGGINTGSFGKPVAGLGRWPANVLLDDSQAEALDAENVPSTSRVGNPRGAAAGDGWGMTATGAEYSDAGGPSRFFPTFRNPPERSVQDKLREEIDFRESRGSEVIATSRVRAILAQDGETTAPSAEGPPALSASDPDLPTFRYQAKAPTRERPTVVAEDGTKTAHPTVKPLALMRWLVRLVTPPGGTVLDTFAGSGATIEAAGLEGFRSIGIEREADYLPLIQVRLDRLPRSTM